jgi:hypothetical protein
MRELDLRAYRDAFGSIHGAFTMDAALLFFAYDALNEGARGSVFEIGVHHGLSAIAVAALRGDGGSMVAVDTFGASRDVVGSGGMTTDEHTFRANMSRFHRDTGFVRVIAADSRTLQPADLGAGFSFCHIDGGHSADETSHDLSLAADVAMPGALVALDDYFNPSFPGVSEGTVRYLIDRPGALVPLAIGANKVIFRRGPGGDLNARFVERYPFIPRTRAVFAGSEVLVFGSGVAKYVDVERSTIARLAPRDLVLRAEIDPAVRELIASPGETVPLALRVRNRSSVPFEWSDSPHGLSYHVLRSDGTAERYENARIWFIPPLPEGAERDMTLAVIAPDRPDEYVVEVDVVWEGICWLRDRGNAPARLQLRVR